MATRIIEWDANTALRLLTHYTEGQVPLDAELTAVKVSQVLQNYLGFVVRSKDWQDPIGPEGVMEPLHIRYEGNRVMIWKKTGTDAFWSGPEDRRPGGAPS